MPNAGEILRKFYAAVAKKEIAKARAYLCETSCSWGSLRRTIVLKNTLRP